MYLYGLDVFSPENACLEIGMFEVVRFSVKDEVPVFLGYCFTSPRLEPHSSLHSSLGVHRAFIWKATTTSHGWDRRDGAVRRHVSVELIPSVYK